MIQKISKFLIIVSIIFIAYVKFSKINLLSTENLRFNAININFLMSLIISLLFILSWKNKLTFIKLINILWATPLTMLLFYIFLESYDFEKIDYLLSKKQKFNIEQYSENKWNISQIIVSEKDTIYFSQNPKWNKIIKLNKKENIEVRKSIFQKYYHLRLMK